MPQVIFTERFRCDVKRLFPLASQIQKQIEFFLQNPKHPSLRTKKLRPLRDQLYSFRINKQFRIIFTYQEKIPILLYISKHYEER